MIQALGTYFRTDAVLRIATVLAALGWGATEGSASSAFVPMGDYARQAEVVALVDSRPSAESARDLRTVLTFREILKGDPGLAGREFVLTRRYSSSDAFAPRHAEGFAVLLRGDWENHRQPLLTVYEKAHEIEILRAFVEIDRLPTERERLLALRERLDEARPQFGQQLMQDFGRMQDEGNFDLLTGLFEDGDEAVQVEVVRLIGHIGDLRGVPTLIAALDSPDRFVAFDAARALQFDFRGAPGVKEAFRRILESPDHVQLHSSAESYLAAYDEAIAARIEADRNAFQRASALLQRGDERGARPYFDLILDDTGGFETLVRSRPDWVARILRSEPETKDRLRPVLLPILEEQAKEDNHLWAVGIATLLGALSHPEAAPLLLELLERADQSRFERSTRIAAFALAELGGEFREQAMASLDTREDGAALRPLLEEAEDEGARLVASLENMVGEGEYGGGGSTDAPGWVIHRLGELREERAIEPLFRMLGWSQGLRTQAADALVRIGGERVEAAALGLLQHPDEKRVRRTAVDIVFRLQGERALPLARRMLAEEDFGRRSAAALFLATHGVPEDLEILVPLSDFWTGDRENHYWLQSAVSAIRRRHGYDLHGPIEGRPVP